MQFRPNLKPINITGLSTATIIMQGNRPPVIQIHSPLLHHLGV